jgi:hypothetical protein
MATLGHGAMSIPDGLLAETQRNMAKSMSGFLKNPYIGFNIFLTYKFTQVAFWVLP